MKKNPLKRAYGDNTVPLSLAAFLIPAILTGLGGKQAYARFMDTIAVQYLYDPSKSEELAAARPAHREFLGTLFEQGTLLASGPLGEHMALIILDVTSAEDALALLDDDPLMEAGVIRDRSAQLWNVVYHTWD